MELLVLFILLTIFLLRTNNLTLNVIIFLLFNAYECQSPGKKITVITEGSSDDIESEENVRLVRVFDHIYIFASNHKKLRKKLIYSVAFFILALLTVIYFHPDLITLFNLSE